MQAWSSPYFIIVGQVRSLYCGPVRWSGPWVRSGPCIIHSRRPDPFGASAYNLQSISALRRNRVWFTRLWPQRGFKANSWWLLLRSLRKFEVQETF